MTPAEKQQLDDIEEDRKERERLLLLLLLGLCFDAETAARNVAVLGGSVAPAIESIILRPVNGLPAILRQAADSAFHSAVDMSGSIVPGDYEPPRQPTPEEYKGAIDPQKFADALVKHIGKSLGDDESPAAEKIAEAFDAAGVSRDNSKMLADVAATQINAGYQPGLFGGFQGNPIVTGLKFLNPNDQFTGPICKVRVGVQLPKNDRWWLRNLPLLHWGCRSSVVAIVGYFVATKSPPNLPAPQPGFGFAPTAWTRAMTTIAHNLSLEIPELETMNLSTEDDMGGHWRTISGAHVLIGSDGTILKGPARLSHLIGKHHSELAGGDKLHVRIGGEGSYNAVTKANGLNPPTLETKPHAPIVTDKAFAHNAQAAAQRVSAHGPGAPGVSSLGDKVLVSHVHAEYEKAHGAIPLATFKQRLSDVNGDDHGVSLVREDLVPAEKAGEFAASEVKRGASSYHYIRTGKPGQAAPRSVDSDISKVHADAVAKVKTRRAANTMPDMPKLETKSVQHGLFGQGAVEHQQPSLIPGGASSGAGSVRASGGKGGSAPLFGEAAPEMKTGRLFDARQAMLDVLPKTSPPIVDPSRQFGIFAKDASGAPAEIGEKIGQANLFGKAKYAMSEPPKLETRAVVGSANASDPRHTAEIPFRESGDATLAEIRRSTQSDLHSVRRPNPEMAALPEADLASKISEYESKAGPIKERIAALKERVKAAKQALGSTSAEKEIGELNQKLEPIESEYRQHNKENGRRKSAIEVAKKIESGRDVPDFTLASHPELIESHGDKISLHREQMKRHGTRSKEWDAAERGATPTERQSAIIESTRKAMASGEKHSGGIQNFVKNDIPQHFPNDEATAKSAGVEGGDAAMDIYHARSIIDAEKSQAKKVAETVNRERFHVGKQFKSIEISGKKYTNAAVTAVDPDGTIRLSGNRGGRTYKISTRDHMALNAIDNPSTKNLSIDALDLETINLSGEGDKEPHSYSCTHIELPPEIAAKVKGIADSIDPADLDAKGREIDPHVTVKYGLDSNSPAATQKALAGEMPVRFKMGGLKVFPANEKRNSDVLVAHVHSTDLERLNRKVSSATPHVDTYSEYQPHATIAYLKPGAGQKYVTKHGDALRGMEGMASEVVHTDRMEKPTRIPLDGVSRAPTTMLLSMLELETINLDSGEVGSDQESGWKTIQGSHVYIDDDGAITKGAAHLVGKNVKNLPERAVSQKEHQAESHKHVTELLKEQAKGGHASKAAIEKHSAAIQHHQGHADELKRKNDAEKTKPKETPAGTPLQGYDKEKAKSAEDAVKDVRNHLRDAGHLSDIKAQIGNGKTEKISASRMGRITPDGTHVLTGDGETEMPISSIHKLTVDGKEVWSKSASPSKMPTKPTLETQSAGAVPVDVEVAHAAKSGKLNIPTGADGKIDPHLEAAYRRHAEKHGLEIGKFEPEAGGGSATARVGPPAKPELETKPTATKDDLVSVQAKEPAINHDGSRKGGAEKIPAKPDSKTAGQKASEFLNKPELETSSTKSKDDLATFHKGNARPGEGKGEKIPDKPKLETKATPMERAEKSPKPESAKPYSRERLANELVAHHESVAGTGTYSADDEAWIHSHSSGSPFVYDEKSAGEVKSLVGDNHALKRIFRKAGPGEQAGFADAYGADPKRYEAIANSVAGSPLKAAVHTAENSPDPELRLKAAIHETPEEGRGKALVEQSVDKMKIGDKATVKGVEIEKAIGADGKPVIKDHGDLPETPVDALTTIPIDKGSFKAGPPDKPALETKSWGGSSTPPGPAFPAAEGELKPKYDAQHDLYNQRHARRAGDVLREHMDRIKQFREDNGNEHFHEAVNDYADELDRRTTKDRAQRDINGENAYHLRLASHHPALAEHGEAGVNIAYPPRGKGRSGGTRNMSMIFDFPELETVAA